MTFIKQSGEIEQVVTKLLRTTKALLEALTQWSLMRLPSNEIYDIHDTLEKQFFLVSQAFEDASVTMRYFPIRLSPLPPFFFY